MTDELKRLREIPTGDIQELIQFLESHSQYYKRSIVQALLDRIEELEKKNSEQRAYLLASDHLKLFDRISKLEGALKVLSDKDQWENYCCGCSVTNICLSDVSKGMKSFIEVAREALEK